MNTIKVEYKYTEAVAVQASLELTKSISKSLTLMPWFGGTVVILSLSAPMMFNVGFSDMAVLTLFGIFLLAMPYTAKRKARRNFRRNPNANSTIKYLVDEDGIRIETDGSEARFNWDRLLKVVEREAGFLLFVQARLAHWMPKESFEDQRDIAELRNLVRSCRAPITS